MFSGGKLREQRMNKAWSQEKLAAESKVSYGYIAELENNKKKPSYETAEKLADALNISILDLQEKLTD